MNNLIRLKKMAGFAFVLCFIIIGTNNLTGQIKLKKNVGSGGPQEGAIFDYNDQVNEMILECLVSSENTSSFTFEFYNFYSEFAEIQINQLEITHNSIPLTINESFPILITQNSDHDFNVEHNKTWSELGNSCPEFNINIEYTITVQYLNDLVDSESFEENYNFQIPICGTLCDETVGGKGTTNNSDGNNGTKDEGSNEHRLNQNIIESSIYPNPTDGSFQINYTLESDEIVNISLFNSTGKKINTIVNQTQEKGEYTLECNELEKYANGIYYVMIRTGDEIHTQKIVKF